MRNVQTTPLPRTRALTLRGAAMWMLTFAGFPLGSVAARALVGPVDGPWSAVLGGLVNGAVIGAAQAWALGRTRPPALAWITATGVGLAVGLWLGAGAVDYATDPRSLVIQGAICGAATGLAQAVVLAGRTRALAAVWPVLLACTWALGWAVTVAVGVEVDLQFTLFGSGGAITVTALTLVLPAVLNRTRQERQS